MLDLSEHPVISFIMVSLIALGICFGLGTLIYYFRGNNNPYNYRYIDLDGNEGYAQWCNHDEPLNCYTNKGYVQVKEFHKND